MTEGWYNIHEPEKPQELVSKGGYRVLTITGPDRLAEAFRVRCKVFSHELGWTVCNDDGLESDKFDESAVHFGVYGEDGALAAYVRLLLPCGMFMLEDVFRPMLGECPIVRKEKDTAEVSRLCVDPGCRGDASNGVVMLLFAGLHRWCCGRGIRFLYAVAEERVRRLYYNRGLHFRAMGEPVKMPDGLVARAAVLDWREQERLFPLDSL